MRGEFPWLGCLKTPVWLTSPSGAVYSGISAGRGKFVAVEEIRLAPCVAFTVVKDRLKRTISVDVQSGSLARTISNALDTNLAPGFPVLFSPDLRILLDNYELLKQYLELLHSHIPDHFETQEFRLLVQDFLLDRAVFEGLGLEQSDCPFVLSQALLRDLHERSIDIGLDSLDDCFRLGAVPFDMGDDDLQALTKRYSQIALSSGVHPSGVSEPQTPSRNPAPSHDPVLGSAEPELSGSCQSFSNLAFRIKGLETASLSSGVVDSPPTTMADARGSVDCFFKVESPLRPGPARERYALGESAPELCNGGFTSLSALENPSAPAGSGDSTPLPRARASSFHNGTGHLDSNPSVPIVEAFGQYTTSSSEGVSDFGMDMLNGETESESESVLFGARLSSSLPAPSFSAAAYHDPAGVNQTCDPRISTGERQSPHLLRQQLGRNLITSLAYLCRRVRSVIGKREAGSLGSSIYSRFTSFISVWNRGVHVFRQILDNHPPGGLLDVLDCLVVASAVCTALTSYKDQDNGSLYLE